tara:strand:- start:9506 stop:10228 length:723 start_codon:yes stop_codon:yes gene_type:complete
MKRLLRFPAELKRLIYSYVDYDTKTKIALDRYPELLDKAYLYQCMPITQLQNLYFNIVINKLSESVSSKRRAIKDFITDMFPSYVVYKYTDENGEERDTKTVHPLLNTINMLKGNPTVNSKTKGECIVKAILCFKTMKTDDIKIDAFFRKMAYHIIMSTVWYVKRLKRIKLEKEQLRDMLQQEKLKEIEYEKQLVNKQKEQIRRKAEYQKLHDKMSVKLSNMYKKSIIMPIKHKIRVVKL